MSGELRKIEVWVTTRDSTQAPPLPNGEPAYADDVVDAVSQVVQTAVTDWYERGGKDYLKCEPDVI